MLSAAIPSVCPSICLFVRPSVRHTRFVSKRQNISLKFFHNLIGLVVFHHQGSLHKSDGFTPNGGAKYKGSSDFRPICGYVSESGSNALKDEYKVVCALSNSALSMTLSDPESQFQGHSIV